SPDIRTLRPEEQGQRVCERHSRWQYSTRPWQFLAAGGNERGGSNPGGGLCVCVERPRLECPRFVQQVWDAEALGRGGSNPGGGLCGCLERPRFECPRFVHQVCFVGVGGLADADARIVAGGFATEW